MATDITRQATARGPIDVATYGQGKGRPGTRPGAQHHRDAYELLVRDLSAPVLDYICRMVGDRQTAEDLTQDVFAAAFVHLHQLRDAASSRSWIFAIAANHVRNYWRRRRIVQWLPLDAARDVPGDDQPGAAGLDVWRALMKLGREDREILVLVGACGFKAHEAAEVLGISLPAAQKRWQRASTRFAAVAGGGR